MELPIFKIRASAAGQILGGAFNKPTEKQLALLAELQAKEKRTAKQDETLAELIEKRDSKPQLQTGAKTYLQNWMKEQIYNRRKEFSNKYTEKGNLCEQSAIDFLSTVMNYGMIEKNTEHRSNEWMTGECDLNLNGIVEDIKNSWDVFTFPLFATELPDSDYFYQLQVYMCLFDKPRAAVNYCLIDAPEEIIDQVARSASYKAGCTEVDMELHDEVRAKLTYSEIPNNLRLKRFEFDRDERIIQAIKDRVELCREYILQEWNKLQLP